MTRRGYFEKQGDEYRLRIVKPGFDADDPGVSPNNVIIDSHSLGTLSVVKSGVGTIPNSDAYAAGVWVASGWGLPYVPLCTFMYALRWFTGDPNDFRWMPYPDPSFYGAVQSIFQVTNDGIYARRGEIYPSSGAYPMYIHYTAYRLPV